MPPLEFKDITFDSIISIENLLYAWREFRRGKKARRDVQEFELHLMDSILRLHYDLMQKTYTHGPYEAFNISDPKPRNIHKATVRDRLLHHALCRMLYPAFDRTFIAHSYSCRRNKGTHRAMDTFTAMARNVSNNHTKTVWVLKCDIRKFFASIDHDVLQRIVRQKISDKNVLWLLQNITDSFETEHGKGLPLGNLTSQLLVNIYMNEFDQYVKRILKARWYARYADDFVFMSVDKLVLLQLLPRIAEFLRDNLSLLLHPDKVSIHTVDSGIDFLGFVHFSHRRVIRTTSKRRMLRRLGEVGDKKESIQAYLGLLSHGNCWGLMKEIQRFKRM